LAVLGIMQTTGGLYSFATTVTAPNNPPKIAN